MHLNLGGGGELATYFLVLAYLHCLFLKLICLRFKMEGRKEGGGIAIVQIPKFKKFCSSIVPVLT